ncbi:endonuclease/exonuclease/phosphatase family protein [Methylobacterium currus]|uniref:endonuclease/exonuclease/phosphatase family protein n=1 Tax=Methylobacterium currus TaxID=2051553 RepID=UPI001E3DD15C|nr:endonuclease/exonuclease/phosphatase family protein [Methylobacterium currus]UHC14328.1 endonuclease/exonuclease/phosphatase family protein [Methylobacterium currus]
MKALARLALVLLGLTLAAASLIPLVPIEWWAARLLDFPRLQLAAALAVVGLGLAPLLRTSPGTVGPALALAIAALVVNVIILWPYRPTGTTRPGACPIESQLSVLVANVQLGNRNAEALVEAVERVEPDLLLAMETDAWWDDVLKSRLGSMPHSLQRITGSYYGIHLFSRLPLVNGEIRHPAGQDTPAVVTGITLRSGEVVTFVGLHPKPPQVWQSARGRDAELYAAANVLRERRGSGLLAGDLNATPWELAVERMQRLAGLIDPRRGYGYVATWNAQSSWMRWPLDHVLHDGTFATLAIERLDAFGSDHFPYLVRLCRQVGEHPKTPSPRDADDIATANAVLAAAGATERLLPR